MRAIALLLGLAGLVASATNMPLHASADTTTHNDSPVLIYIYSPECGACRQFDREVGPIYEKTAESLALPLERVLIDEWQADRASAGRMRLGGGHRYTDFLADPELSGAGSHHRLLRRRALLAGAPQNDESDRIGSVTIRRRRASPRDDRDGGLAISPPTFRSLPDQAIWTSSSE